MYFFEIIQKDTEFEESMIHQGVNININAKFILINVEFFLEFFS